MHRRSLRRPGLLTALLLLLALFAAACGSGDDGDGGGQQAGGTTEDGGGTETTAAAEDEGQAQAGGRAVIGLIAESSQGWNPSTANWAISGHMVAKSVYDTLLQFDTEGVPAPNLAESVEPNADFTEWRITLRDGIQFHNGDPLDGAALKANLDALVASPLTAPALNAIDPARITIDPADPMTVTVGMRFPWVGFNTFMAGSVPAGQGFYIAHPETVADENGASPIGTGPFVFQEWVLDNRFVATKNPNYWKVDENGTQLPYLDEIEYRVIPDHSARLQALRNGEIDVMQTDQGPLIADMRTDDEAGTIALVETTDFTPTGYVMFNNAVAPLDDVRVRRAIAHATDYERYLEINANVPERANGPFHGEIMGTLEDSGFPSFDQEEARRLVEEYEAEVGPIQFNLGTVAGDAINLQNMQELQSQWSQVGIDVEIVTVEEQAYIGNALIGDFQAYAWRNHAGTDPDQQWHWWSSLTSADLGSLALNFGRFEDPQIDELLTTIRTNPDEAARQEAAEGLNRRFAEQVYNLWLTETVWAVATAPDIRGVTSPVSGVEGVEAAPLVDGQYQVASIWRAS